MIKCENCIHETVCKAWMRELETAEDAYDSRTDYVTIYDRYVVEGDGCEHFEGV